MGRAAGGGRAASALSPRCEDGSSPSSSEPSVSPSSPSRPPRPSSQPPPRGARAVIERASLPALTRLSRMPAAVPFLVLLGLLIVGVVVGGMLGAVCTAAVTVVVAWLLYLGWPRLTGVERLGRSAVLLLAVGMTMTQALGPS
ncbi:MAG: DUF6703 family protein [Angustibacter sp.]